MRKAFGIRNAVVLGVLATAPMWASCGRIGLELMPNPDVSDRDGGPGGDPNGDGSVGPGDGDVDGGGSCTEDTDGDGQADCIDACNGVDDASYVPDESCGVGYCRTSNAPSSCVDGVETECVAGMPIMATDATCDGVDDDCDGQTDEDYVATAITCGFAQCQRSGQRVCQGGVAVAMCTPGTPGSTSDATLDGVDDDCDGLIDEDVVCSPSSVNYEAGTHTIMPGVCSTLTVRLWGAGGAAGDDGGYWGLMNIARGGAGGYTERTFTVNKNSSIQLLIGRGGQGCSGAGANDNGAYSGGAGGASNKKPGIAGQDGSVAGGGVGTSSGGGAGGAGFFGGGGGGAGTYGIAAYAPYGPGGGGGAASVVNVDGVSVIAGGGGGGGGMGSNFATTSFPGGVGGAGCSGKGANSGSSGGGGGGGGVCQGGSAAQTGNGSTPFDVGSLPAGVAKGGEARCAAGGGGYAIITLAP